MTNKTTPKKNTTTKQNKEKKEIKQITIREFDERFYQRGDEFAPSVTFILDATYPSGYGLTKWIGDVGNKRAEEIRDETAEEGSFVHEAIEKMLLGQKISNEDITSRFIPRRSLKIKRCLKSFIDWYEETEPEIIETEKTIWNDEFLYAGTLDLKCKINGEIYIIDFKTSNSVQPKMKCQLSAYNYAETNGTAKQAILHLGNTTKKRYSFIEVDFERYFNQFLTVKKLFDELHPNAKPTDEAYPEWFYLQDKI